jgi:hypothetical protein
VEIPKTGPLAKCLKDLRTNGKCKLEFRPEKEFRAKFDIPKVVTFHTHVELDKFVKQLMQKDFDFPEKEKEVFQFLKSFDRAFWIRHFKILEMSSKSEAKKNQMQTKLSEAGSDKKKEITDLIINIEKEIATLQQENQSVKPLEEVDDADQDCTICMCPFKDPSDTQSIIFL